MEPRIVMVRRQTAFEALLHEHGTENLAAYRLAQTGQTLDSVRDRHHQTLDAAQRVLGRVPTVWRKTWTLRRDLPTFRFDPEDVVVAVGLDGLVPNVARYLNGQPVIGVNPTEWRQRMMHFAPDDIEHLYAAETFSTEARTMARVDLNDGRSLVALNEVFCGHQSHQSAKYDIAWSGSNEYQSSSGLLVTTGTGATGWARSISEATSVAADELPTPTEASLYFMVREAWASSFTGTEIVRGRVGVDAPKKSETKNRGKHDAAGSGPAALQTTPTRSPGALQVVSRMQEGGVLFGDGIEADALTFAWGQVATFRVADQALNLVIPS